jgi:hypothetical protein
VTSQSSAAAAPPQSPPTPRSASDRDKLLGSWRLLRFVQTIVATGETVDVFGTAPQGTIHYGDDGRMIVLMVKDERPRPQSLALMTDEQRIELFKTMVAYAGSYSVDGSTVTHHLDASWNQLFTGADQVRTIEIDEPRMIMSTQPQPRSQDGEVAVSVITWERLR